MRIETHNTGNREAKAIPESPVAVSASISRLDVADRQNSAAGIQKLPEGDRPSNERVETEKLSAAVRDINDYVQQVQRTLQFSVDDDTGTTVVKVLDSATDEVIRQFPPEEALALARHLQASQETQSLENSGLILHARA